MKLEDLKPQPMELNKGVVTETSKLSKIKQILAKQKDIGSGMLIVSPENPGGEPQSREVNNRRLEKSKRWLANKNYYVQKGVFGGHEETSLVIRDVSLGWSEKFAELWGQQAFIWVNPGNEETGMKIEYYDKQGEGGYKATASAKVAWPEDVPPEQNDMYSKIGGQKYTFPFEF